MSGAAYSLFGTPTTLRNDLSGIPFVLPLTIGGSNTPAWIASYAHYLTAGLVGATCTATAAGSGSTTLTLSLTRNVTAFPIATISFASGSTTGLITAQASPMQIPGSVANPALQDAVLLIRSDALSLTGTPASGLSGVLLLLPATFL